MEASKKFHDEVLSLLGRHLPKKEVQNLLEKPPENIGAELALPCFAFAKKFRKSPVDIAREVSSKLKPKGMVREARPVGPYINFYADAEKMASLVIKRTLKAGKNYGSSVTGKGKKVMVEYAQPNPFKAFHIGHVRNIALGESLCRILEFSGSKVIRANFQGDIGPHVAKAIWGLINIYKGKPPKGVDKGIWLGKVYKEAGEAAAGDIKIEKEIEEINRLLYAGDKKIISIWKTGRKWSLDHFDNVYKDFGTKFDRLYMESEVEKPGVKIAQELFKKGVAKRSEGAIVIDMKKEGLGIFLILKSDGIALYSTKDLALAKIQDKEFKPDKIIHVVGSEQKLYFQQLFRALELIDKRLAEKEHHLSYELVNLATGKMKSREGKVITYDELKKKLYELALKATKEKNPSLKATEHEKIAEKVALGAIKYGMLMQSPEKVIIFNWKQALDFQGNSAPYVQYTHARACSILKKSKSKTSRNFDASLLVDKKETKIVKLLSSFQQTVENAARDWRPHYIAGFAHELATAFNEFYQTIPVLAADKKTKNARLALVEAVKITLKNTMFLLGIDAPERM